MTKTVPAPKVSYISEPVAPKAEAQAKAKSQAAGDIYESAGPNAYKGLISGEIPLANGIAQGDIGDMMDAMAGAEAQRPLTYYEKIQNIISGYASIADTKKVKGVDINGDIPFVPNFRRDIMDGHALESMPMRPVVQRYNALIKVLETMRGEAKKSLSNNNACSMTAAEIKSMHSYVKKLEESLGYCRQQLRDATDCLNSAIDDGSEFDWIDSSV